jgi:hypothetical protein
MQNPDYEVVLSRKYKALSAKSKWELSGGRSEVADRKRNTAELLFYQCIMGQLESLRTIE